MIHEHHVWCKYLDNPHGNSWKGNIISRVNLTEEQHKRLHLEILNNYSRALKRYKHEEYIWKNFISELDKENIINEIVNFTLKFIKQEEKKDDSIPEI